MIRKLIHSMSASFVLIAAALTSISLAQEDEWTTKADMPTPRCWFSTSVVNGKIYAIGGWNVAGNNPVFLSAVEEYDPATNTWKKKTDMPTARPYLTTSVVNGKIYAMGGSIWGPVEGNTALSTVEEYDPATDTWTKKADLTATKVYFSSSVANGKIYAIGSSTAFGATVEEYDPATDRWVRKADMPTARGYLSASTVNGKIYAIGGSIWAPVKGTTVLSTVEEYDPATDTWTKKANMPMPTNGHAASVVNGKIYVIGGRGALTETPGADETMLSTIMKYDPAADTWTKEGDMLTPKTGLSASVVDGRMYVIGGYEIPVKPISTVQAYQAVPWGFAHGPYPSDGALHPDSWVTLSWGAGDFAASHSVYLSDNLDAVNHGLVDAYRGNQASTSLIVGFPEFSYPEGLVRGTTYYWRVDEVNDAEPNSPWKGSVWSFRIPPKRAYDPDPSNGAESVELDAELSWTAGLGAALHTVYFGDNRAEVSNATGGLQQAQTTYRPGTLEFAKTYYWRVDEFEGGRGGGTHKGDVWSFTTKGTVSSPNPSHGAVDVKTTSILNWNPGLFAASHEVYLGTDEEAVRGATTDSPEYIGSRELGDEILDPGKLAFDTTYFWRVDEVNDAHADSPWVGNIWSFTTADFIVVDDFESYNDLNEDELESNRIYLAWIDGFDNPAVNGSVVGYVDPPFAEQTMVHSGGQSMPFAYNNGVGKSEATLTLTYPRDWTENGVSTLSIWFVAEWDWMTRVSPNDTEPMYVVLNGDAVVYHDDPSASKIHYWTEWRIDLKRFSDQGVDLTNVNTIAIGFGDRDNPQAGGKGLMFFDDIRLCR